MLRSFPCLAAKRFVMPSPTNQPPTALPPVLGGPEAVLEVDLDLYSRVALLRTAHRFTGRCYVELGSLREPDATKAGSVRVSLRPRSGEGKLQELTGEFLNDLLDETLREEIARETEPVRNLLLAHALSETTFLRPELEDVDPESDPLGVATHQQPVPRGERVAQQ